ncbi:AAA ATPase domain-containing protein [Amycolatopsis xylanica]|uniref:AAA ATPase domain-containing protein n=1 Tax=Amycolatopsis xylanica TaxID=589385 RepID=A0A1H2T5R9_9PSEU|nr:ATP-binding protein [Amycolatopsis xylanica]SDW39222.1 AAA ATPase domain-containing protein [Amycolatopsis xylanica]
MRAKLGDRLAAARRRAFVGREAELELFRSLVTPGSPGSVVFVHGPGGVGKSTLLRQFGWLAEDLGRRVVRLDGRELELPDVDDDHVVLIVDNAELIMPVERWLRDELFPVLAEDAVVVLGGREPPPVVFRTDPGWLSMVRPIRLANLDRSHGIELLRMRGVPDTLHGRALAFTHGHPLALALLADVSAQSDGLPETTATPEVLRVLLHSLIGTVPTPDHRAALEASAQVLVTTEPLLAAMLGLRNARELFDWLRGLSIMDYAPRGLFPHDFVRETLATELRWRNPEAYQRIRGRARAYYQQQFADSDAASQRASLLDFAFLYRENPILGPFLADVGPELTSGPPSPGEWPSLAAVIEKHEGDESAAIASRWYASQPSSVTVIRDSESAVGVIVAPALDAASEADVRADPAAVAVLPRLREGKVLLVRHWMSVDGHQRVSDVVTYITVVLIRLYLATPDLAQVFVTCADPGFWASAFRYTDFHPVPEAGAFGIFAHDWREVPPMTWMALMADRESVPETTALTEGEFAAAVKQALRDFTRDDRLAESPLAPAGKTPRERARALADLIRAAAAKMEASPKDRRGFRAVHHTYLQPAESQARAAELLDLPTSTYRRHLTAGVTRLTELLRTELGQD